MPRTEADMDLTGRSWNLHGSDDGVGLRSKEASLDDRHGVVVGVLGATSSPLALEFLAQVPDSTEILAEDGVCVRSSAPVVSRGDGYFWGEPFPSRGAIRDWAEASEKWGVAGLYRDGTNWVLFTDSLGIQPIYTRSHGATVLFSTHLAPLYSLRLVLTADWEAWASVLVLAAPLGSATGFKEIRRLEGAHGLAVGGTGRKLVSYQPNWLAGIENAGPDDLIEVLRQALPDALERPPAVPLSGGWDSRLLAGLAVDHYGEKLGAWTSWADDGRERDLSLAPAVAAALDMEHHVVEQPDRGWPDLASEARRRMGFETWLHTWLVPMSRILHQQADHVLDGLAGDVLIKGLFVDESMLGLDNKGRLDLLFQRLGGRQSRLLPLIDKRPAGAIIEISRHHFMKIAAVFDDHVNQLGLSVLHTRTSRAIALSALRLFGPETRAWMPYLSPHLLAMTLAINPQDKLDGKLSRELLRIGCRQAADLPSTNDPGPKTERTLPRLTASLEAEEWMTDLILSSNAARSLFPSEVVTQMEEGRSDPARLSFDEVRVLQAASLLAEWELRFQDVLRPTKPDWT